MITGFMGCQLKGSKMKEKNSRNFRFGKGEYLEILVKGKPILTLVFLFILTDAHGECR